MTFAQVIDNEIATVAGRVPNAARRLDTLGWVGNLPDASPADQRACGWFQVTDVPRPADTDTHTHTRTVEVVEGTPTVVWTAREFSADEIAARDAAAARDAQQATAQSWLRVLSDWAQQDGTGDDPEEVVLAVKLAFEATAVLLVD